MRQATLRSFRYWATLMALTFACSMQASAGLIIDIKECQFEIPDGYALRLGSMSGTAHFYFHEEPEKAGITISTGQADLTFLKEELTRRLSYKVDEGKTALGDYVIFRSSQGIAELDAGVAHIMGWTIRLQGEAVNQIQSINDDCERSSGVEGVSSRRSHQSRSD